MPISLLMTCLTYASVQPSLRHVSQLRAGLINGSAPRKEADFKYLKNRGIRTIISVDGAIPDVESAKSVGIGYVHIPLGYDGIDEPSGLALLQAYRDLPKPIYIHCFHGVHRSPAAAAYMMTRLGLASSRESINWMKRVGTSREYHGLYTAVEQAQAVSTTQLNAISVRLAERTVVDGFVQAMVALGRVESRLKSIREANLQAPSSHPDLDLGNEVQIMLDYLQALPSNELPISSPEFLTLLNDTKQNALELKQAVEQGLSRDVQIQKLSRLLTSCDHCHQQYRNGPIAE